MCWKAKTRNSTAKTWNWTAKMRNWTAKMRNSTAKMRTPTAKGKREVADAILGSLKWKLRRGRLQLVGYMAVSNTLQYVDLQVKNTCKGGKK